MHKFRCINVTKGSCADPKGPQTHEPNEDWAFRGTLPAALLPSDHMLRVKRLAAGARLPVVAHPGEDLGYDVFALEGDRTGAAGHSEGAHGDCRGSARSETDAPLGLLVRDRSSMAARGLATTGGVIDAGYRGEILIVMTNLGDVTQELQAGEKIAQMVPVPVLTGPVQEVESLEVLRARGQGVWKYREIGTTG